ncbi:MAG: hypothetical protein WC784_01735 [Candidatus Shapirobacteria bacterium]
MSVENIPPYHPIDNYYQRFNQILSELPTLESINQRVNDSSYQIIHEVNTFPLSLRAHTIIDVSDPKTNERRVIICDQPNSYQDYYFDAYGCLKAIRHIKSDEQSMREEIFIDKDNRDIVKYNLKFTYSTGSTEEKIDLSSLFASHTVAYKNKLGELIREDKLPL